jgi:hypothetical protein
VPNLKKILTKDSLFCGKILQGIPNFSFFFTSKILSAVFSYQKKVEKAAAESRSNHPRFLTEGHFVK